MLRSPWTAMAIRNNILLTYNMRVFVFIIYRKFFFYKFLKRITAIMVYMIQLIRLSVPVILMSSIIYSKDEIQRKGDYHSSLRSSTLDIIELLLII